MFGDEDEGPLVVNKRDHVEALDMKSEQSQNSKADYKSESESESNSDNPNPTNDESVSYLPLARPVFVNKMDRQLLSEATKT